MPLFDSPFEGRMLAGLVRNPNIRVGRYSYYSGYYHGHDFDDCARYLAADRDDVDKLIIGSFCSIGSGASFIMAGNQGHRTDWIATYPFFYMQDEQAFAAAVPAYTVVAGMPARAVRRRFDEESCALLEEMQWWDWPLERIRDAMPLLCSSNVRGLYAFWDKGRFAAAQKGG